MIISHSESYKAAGVDINAGYEAVERMRSHTARTMIPGVLSSIGGFGGLFEPDLSGVGTPVFVSGTDGVGTKLKLAFLMDKHDTIGIDCVAMCVNDIVCAGAKPLFFLDYLALGKNVPSRVEAIVSGVADGCVQAGCALIGGETAEMPGFYPEDEYDLAGFSCGIVDKRDILDPKRVSHGDVIIALASSGPHSNGFSLIRKVFDIGGDPSILSKHYEELNMTLGEALLMPTRIYVKPLLNLTKAVSVKSAAHITGGGLYENIPRCLPDGCRAMIRKDCLRVPPVFDLISGAGGIDADDMFSTFNMGVGMCVIVGQADRDKAVSVLKESGVDAYIMGNIQDGERGVELQ